VNRDDARLRGRVLIPGSFFQQTFFKKSEITQFSKGLNVIEVFIFELFSSKKSVCKIPRWTCCLPKSMAEMRHAAEKGFSPKTKGKP